MKKPKIGIEELERLIDEIEPRQKWLPLDDRALQVIHKARLKNIGWDVICEKLKQCGYVHSSSWVRSAYTRWLQNQPVGKLFKSVGQHLVD